MTQDYKHPTAPPEELIEKWLAEPEYVAGWDGRCHMINVTEHRFSSICAKAAQWGADQANADIERKLQEVADQELEACIDWMKRMGYWGDDGKAIPALRAARRPSPNPPETIKVDGFTYRLVSLFGQGND